MASPVVKLKRTKVAGHIPHVNQLDTETLVHNIIDGIWYAMRVLDDGTKEVYCLGGQPINPYGILQDVYTKDDPDFPVLEHLFKRNGITETKITTLLKLNGIVWGGTVIWKEGLTFIVRRLVGYINAMSYAVIIDTEVTLEPADPDNPRIDLIILNTDSEVTYIKGVPAADPQKPTPDPLTQLEITQVLINANETTPTGVSEIIAYDEHAEGEWSPTESGTTVNYDYMGITSFHGTKCAKTAGLTNNDTITFTGPVTNVADINSFMSALRLQAVSDKSYSLYVRFCLNGIIIMRDVKLDFVGDNTTSWQVLGFNFAAQTFAGTSFNEIVFTWRKTGTNTEHAGIYLDYIKFTGGLQSPPEPAMIMLVGDVIGSGLTGTQINTNLKIVNQNVGTYGSATKVARITVDAKGRVTGVQEVDIPAGQNGLTPFIGVNGNWWIGEEDTGVQAEGQDGDDGVTPHIGVNLHWFIGEVDTGIIAQGIDGDDGLTPYIGGNGNWFIGVIDTGVQAEGQDGITPHIGANGNWYIGTTDTGVKAEGLDGQDGVGVPPGGTLGQVLHKDGPDDYDTSWGDNNIVIPSQIPVNQTSRGIIGQFQANEIQAFGDAVYINANGKAQLANASAIGTSYVIGLLNLATVAQNGVGNYLQRGRIRNDAWNLTVGGVVWLSAVGTSGNTLTQVPPTAQSSARVAIGIAVGAHEIDINPSLSIATYKV